jgi:hypothetical protein
MEDITPKLEKIMEEVFERFVADRGLPVAGRFTRMLMPVTDELAWTAWLSEKGISTTKKNDTVPCRDPHKPIEWPVRLQVPMELAMTIVTLGDLR